MTQTISQYQVKQERCEGPMCLLLDLIERERLPINEISLSRVTDEYLAEVRAMEAPDQEALAEFLVVAAQLMLIKSRSLLPHLKLSTEDEESIDDLEKRLSEYKNMKELAKELQSLEKTDWHIFSREAFLGIPSFFYPPPGVSANILEYAFLAVIKTIPQLEKLAEEKLKKVISLEEKIRDIQSRLSQRLEHMFSEFVVQSKEKVEVVISFLAILELAKQRLVLLKQDKNFADIRIQRREI